MGFVHIVAARDGQRRSKEFEAQIKTGRLRAKMQKLFVHRAILLLLVIYEYSYSYSYSYSYKYGTVEFLQLYGTQLVRLNQRIDSLLRPCTL